MTVDLMQQGTSTTALPVEAPLNQTRTSADLLAEEVGFLRNRVRMVDGDVAAIHTSVLARQLGARTNELRKHDTVELLNSLADQGFAWRDIARIAGVSVPALRKWREGGGVSGEHSLEIARLCAFCTIAQNDHLLTQEVAAWLEQPILSGWSITGLDLVAEHRFEDLLELAAGQIGPEELLDRCVPGWRDIERDTSEVFIAPDGAPGILVR